MWVARHRPITIRLLAAAAGVFAAMAAFANPADADTTDDAFITALNTAGVDYGDPAAALALGHVLCPMLSEQGGSFASAASTVAAIDHLSPEMSEAFTGFAITMFCPSVMSNLADGGLSALQQVPGLPGF
ncbi:DUF732 domain-containing protein [Mycobacterium spongiae]|uniref:DUF732 domain-containing protein n=1 Tax=Mycobacterium spongiae TaxID=886343 RepID=A0A975K203_9MYCO|nr:DUF732 domain-containing protein [Mycobacterium spongiae]